MKYFDRVKQTLVTFCRDISDAALVQVCGTALTLIAVALQHALVFVMSCWSVVNHLYPHSIEIHIREISNHLQVATPSASHFVDILDSVELCLVFFHLATNLTSCVVVCVYVVVPHTVDALHAPSGPAPAEQTIIPEPGGSSTHWIALVITSSVRVDIRTPTVAVRVSERIAALQMSVHVSVIFRWQIEQQLEVVVQPVGFVSSPQHAQHGLPGLFFRQTT